MSSKAIFDINRKPEIPHYDKAIETTELFSRYFHCFGSIRKRTDFTDFLLFCRGVSQKIAKSVSFQTLTKQ